MTIDILCKVVDNLGDIGFVYRLARSLSEIKSNANLRIIIDDLNSFALLCPEIKPHSAIQKIGRWTIIAWNNEGENVDDIFSKDPVSIVLECYACGRPQWFDSFLFDLKNTKSRTLINIEYLTAEPWSVDFHLLPSFTISPMVKKVIFMPGFMEGTGGLLLDENYKTLLTSCSSKDGRLKEKGSFLSAISSINGEKKESFWITLFSYEHNFETLVSDITEFHKTQPLIVFVASGRSAGPFYESYTKLNCSFPIERLPMLEQKNWDMLLACSDFLFVRGEESLSRAVLSGNPFLWECYPFVNDQNELSGHHVKIEALVNLLTQSNETNASKIIQRNMYDFNHFYSQSCELSPGFLLGMLEKMEEIRPIYAEFARKTKEVGNLAEKLMTYLCNIG